MSTDPSDRLKLARQRAGYDDAASAARAFGWNQHTYKSHENGVRGLRRAVAERYAQAFSVSAGWLMHDENRPEWASKPSMPTANNIRMTPGRRLPVLSYVQAGRMTEIVDLRWIDEAEGYEIVGDGGDLTDHSFVLTIVGDSMLPDFRPGEKVVVTPDLEVRPGDYVVAAAEADTAATFKKYRPRGADANGEPIVELAPLNEDYPSITLDARRPGRIIGKVVRHIRTF